MLGVGLLRPQPIGEAAAAHQREDEARRLVLQIVAKQRQQVRVATLLQHTHLALQIAEIVHAQLGAFHGYWLVAQPRRQSLGRQRWQRIRDEDAAVATAADEPLLSKAVRRRCKLGEGEGDGRRRRRGRLEGLRCWRRFCGCSDAQSPEQALGHLGLREVVFVDEAHRRIRLAQAGGDLVGGRP